MDFFFFILKRISFSNLNEHEYEHKWCAMRMRKSWKKDFQYLNFHFWSISNVWQSWVKIICKMAYVEFLAHL